MTARASLSSDTVRHQRSARHELPEPGNIRLLSVGWQDTARLRYRVPGIFNNRLRADRIATALQREPWVLDARADASSASLRLVVIPDLSLDDINSRVDQVVAHHAPSAEARVPAARREVREPETRTELRELVRHAAKALGVHVPAPERSVGKPELPTASVAQQQYDWPAWHAISGEEVVTRLESAENGLTMAQIKRRQQEFGANRLPEPSATPAWKVMLSQFTQVPVALLGVSAAISVATGGLADAAVIGVVLAANSLIGFGTERQAEKIIRGLSTLSPGRAQVMRDGVPLEVDADELVPGDIMLLTPGTRIAADGRLLLSHHLQVDEAALTGESMPVRKRPLEVPRDTPLADRANMIYLGTHVSGGSGSAVVVATGLQTELGAIQRLAEGHKPPPTPMEDELDRLGTRLAVACGALCAGVFGIGLLRGMPRLPLLQSAVSLAVAAVPEGLPAIASTLLASAVQRMRDDGIYIRRLPAVENLGAVDVVCFDKTGTLTQNSMKVVRVVTPEGESLAVGEAPLALPEPMLRVASLCNDAVRQAESDTGSATELALVDLAADGGVDVAALRERFPRHATKERADGHPYMVTFHHDLEDGYFMAVKGRPREVLERCVARWSPAGPVPLDDAGRAAFIQCNEVLAGDSLRVLALACRWQDADAMGETEQLVFLGLVGLADPLREDVAALIPQFHQAGIRTLMITGDQAATAAAVAESLGLDGGEGVKVVRMDQLEGNPEQLQEVVRSANVFARVTPAMKLAIVSALQEAGHRVMMTGDGINDGPALKAAHVGVAMGKSGTEMAHSMADVVLADDHLDGILRALSQGRSAYANIERAVEYLLSTNMSEIVVMLVSVALGQGNALTPAQLLWLNLMSDVFPALALGVAPADPDVMRRPEQENRGLLGRSKLRRMGGDALLMGGFGIGSLLLGNRMLGGGAAASTQLFMSLTCSQLMHALSLQAGDRSMFSRKAPRNRLLMAGVGVSALVQLLTLTPPLRRLLGTAPLSPMGALAALLMGVGPTLVRELLKLLGGASAATLGPIKGIPVHVR